MELMCPISLKSVNERVAQINAALTVAVVVLFLFTPNIWLITILGADFLIRGFLNPTYSFFSALSKAIVRLFKIRPVMVDSGPKRFAAKIGFIFCCLLALLELSGSHVPGVVIGLIFAFFAALEAMFRLCVACKIYPLVCKVKRSG